MARLMVPLLVMLLCAQGLCRPTAWRVTTDEQALWAAVTGSTGGSGGVGGSGGGGGGGGDRFTLWWSSWEAPTPVLLRAAELSGQLERHGLAAGDGRVYLVYAGSPRMVQSIRPEAAPAPSQGVVFRFSLHASLPGPEAGELLGFSAGTGAGEVHALWRSPLGLRLLRLERSGWVEQEVPDAGGDWQGSQLLASRGEGSRPRLVRMRGSTLRLDEPVGDSGWSTREWEREEPGPLEVLTTQGQVLLAQRLAVEDPWRIGVWLETGVTPVGTLATPDPWSELLAVRDRVYAARWEYAGSPPGGEGAMRGDVGDVGEGVLVLSGIDLHGRALDAVRISSPRMSISPRTMDRVVLTAALLASGLMMLLMLRSRGVRPVTPPPGTGASDPALRLMAGAVDLLPPMALGWWMSRSSLVVEALPHAQVFTAGLTMGVYVVAGTLDEWITGRTLGKRLFGLWVVRLDGSRPRLGQAMMRNASKAVELILPPLLLLALLNPLRQRLGDQVASTVVVTREGGGAGDGA